MEVDQWDVFRKGLWSRKLEHMSLRSGLSTLLFLQLWANQLISVFSFAKNRLISAIGRHDYLTIKMDDGCEGLSVMQK